MRNATLMLASALLVALPLVAQEEKGDAFGDLFGDSLSGSRKNDLGALEEAAGNVKTGGSDQSLTPKGETSVGKGGVDFLDQFAAEKIQITKKEGCIPAEPERIRLTYLEYLEVPAKSPKLSICLKMASRVNRQVRITASIVNPRLKRVARAESVVSFAGITRTDHVLDYPAMPLDMPGQYMVAIDVDGKTVAKLPLFEVKIGSGD